MTFSDNDIEQAIRRGDISITPFSSNLVQPASVDLRLGSTFLVFEPHSELFIDPLERQELTHAVAVSDQFVMHPGQFVLARTEETIRLSPQVVGRVDGKSSLGRLGLLVHSTAGFIDPGFEGTLTLELSSVAPLPIVLRPGMSVCQISFSMTNTPAVHPYGSPTLNSKYMGQHDPVASRFWQNKDHV